MKASVSPRGPGFALMALLVACPFVQAQDVVVQKDGQRREGQIMGVSNGAIKIKVGPAETSIRLDQVASADKAAPAAYDQALAAWSKGDASAALATIKPVADLYRGLPTPWAQRAASLLPELYLAQNNLNAAQQALADFSKAYPGASHSADVVEARIAVEKSDFATAKTKLEPLLEEARKTLLAPDGKDAVYGQAYYLMGRVNEADNALPEALQNYLTTVTLFNEDQAVVAQAQQRADVLKKNQVIVP